MNIVKTTMLAAGLLMASFQVRAAANAIEEDWQNPEVFEINRLPMRASFTTDQQKTLSLNGEWKFNFCENPSPFWKTTSTLTGRSTSPKR